MGRLTLFLTGIVLCSFCGAEGWNTIFTGSWSPPNQLPIYGYSEVVPPFYLGVRPYEARVYPAATIRQTLLATEAYKDFYDPQHPNTFFVNRYEENRHLQTGLTEIATHWLHHLEKLANGEPAGEGTLRGIPVSFIRNNPYWAEIPKHRGQPIVSFTPLTISRTQWDIGRIHPWTIYGGAEINWEDWFWTKAIPETGGRLWLCQKLNSITSGRIASDCNLSQAGLRIYATNPAQVPQELRDLNIVLPQNPSNALAAQVRYLLTFVPYGSAATAIPARWPDSLRARYANAQTAFLPIPHPATLLFSKVERFQSLATQNRITDPLQIPLVQAFSQFSRAIENSSFYGLRILDVSRRRHRFAGASPAGPTEVGTLLRYENNQLRTPFNLIFEPIPQLMGLYEKPLAKNVQIWSATGDPRWILDGPRETTATIEATKQALKNEPANVQFHYRNYFPPMQVNGFEVRWIRPLVAWTVPRANDPGEIRTEFTRVGHFVATRGAERVGLHAVIRDRDGVDEALARIEDDGSRQRGEKDTTALNVKKLAEFKKMLGNRALPKDLATSLINPVGATFTYERWIQGLPQPVARFVQTLVSGQEGPSIAPHSFPATLPENTRVAWRTRLDARESRYWHHILTLSEGLFQNERTPVMEKNNCDCAATDSNPNGRDVHCEGHRLPRVLLHLKNYYERELGINTVYTQEFDWEMPVRIPWWDGPRERQKNLIVVIHGTDGRAHDKAIVLGDHYDTAYMGDIYEGVNYKENNRRVPELVGHRHASKGADDNFSATATLMEAARVLKDMRLTKDVWLVHLTGEEFPADGLGTRAFARALIEGRPLIPGTNRNPQIDGIFVLDMVGHDTGFARRGTRGYRPIFQISPGRGERSAELAAMAHSVTETWNRSIVSANWNANLGRNREWTRFVPPRNTPPARYVTPPLARFTALKDEIRPGWHFRSSLYNTDPQVFTDFGFPVVLFMEDYDINRQGYHDTMDTIEFIDLDYANAVSTIAVETVAQLATQ